MYILLSENKITFILELRKNKIPSLPLQERHTLFLEKMEKLWLKKHFPWGKKERKKKVGYRTHAKNQQTL